MSAEGEGCFRECLSKNARILEVPCWKPTDEKLLLRRAAEPTARMHYEDTIYLSIYLSIDLSIYIRTSI